jgi:hypothetical protein
MTFDDLNERQVLSSMQAGLLRKAGHLTPEALAALSEDEIRLICHCTRSRSAYILTETKKALEIEKVSAVTGQEPPPTSPYIEAPPAPKAEPAIEAEAVATGKAAEATEKAVAPIPVPVPPVALPQIVTPPTAPPVAIPVPVIPQPPSISPEIAAIMKLPTKPGVNRTRPCDAATLMALVSKEVGQRPNPLYGALYDSKTKAIIFWNDPDIDKRKRGEMPRGAALRTNAPMSGAPHLQIHELPGPRQAVLEAICANDDNWDTIAEALEVWQKRQGTRRRGQ